jgi:hypothetical protein
VRWNGHAGGAVCHIRAISFYILHSSFCWWRGRGRARCSGCILRAIPEPRRRISLNSDNLLLLEDANRFKPSRPLTVLFDQVPATLAVGAVRGKHGRWGQTITLPEDTPASDLFPSGMHELVCHVARRSTAVSCPPTSCSSRPSFLMPLVLAFRFAFYSFVSGLATASMIVMASPGTGKNAWHSNPEIFSSACHSCAVRSLPPVTTSMFRSLIRRLSSCASG